MSAGAYDWEALAPVRSLREPGLRPVHASRAATQRQLRLCCNQERYIPGFRDVGEFKRGGLQIRASESA
jgi:hypothetical protein